MFLIFTSKFGEMIQFDVARIFFKWVDYSYRSASPKKTPGCWRKISFDSDIDPFLVFFFGGSQTKPSICGGVDPKQSKMTH